MTAPDRNDEFEIFLQKRTLLPHSEDTAEPPNALDELVLKKARAAIGGHESATRAARWAVPVGLAATILLCLSIVLNISLNKNPATPILASRSVAPETYQAAEAPAAPNSYAAAPAPAPLARSEMPQLADAPAPETRAEAKGSVAQRQLRQPPTSRTDVNSMAAADSAENALAAKKPSAALAKRQGNEPAPHPRDPKIWLQQIDALRAEGKNAAADAEMDRFRAAFPAYVAKPVPPEPESPKPQPQR